MCNFTHAVCQAFTSEFYVCTVSVTEFGGTCEINLYFVQDPTTMVSLRCEKETYSMTYTDACVILISEKVI